MVLQQDIKVPIWGMADPGETVTVSLAGQTKITKGAADGKWRVNLDPLQTAEGLVLTVQGSKKIEVKDVLVGEVWLGAGQSNMVGRINDYKGRDEGSKKALAAGPFPGLRLFNQETGRWTEATPTTVGNFSALLFHFGAGLLSELKRPVGLMVGAVSGTPSGYWFTEDMYLADESAQAAVKEFAKTYDLNLALEKYDIQLADWKKKAEAARAAGQNPGIEPDRPLPPGGSKAELGHLYKKHILPMVPYGIRGVLWDQGEGGTGITGLDQYHAMGALIKGWRDSWGRDFPFLYVQKPSGGGTAWDLADAITKNASPFAALPAQVPPLVWGEQREMYLKIQTYLNTAMVSSTDLGGETHPSNKSGYGERAKRVALAFVYGHAAEYSGPLYSSHKIEGNTVRIAFTHVGKGLAVRHSEKLQGFQIAGEDRKFFWADAVIAGDEVIVSSKNVPTPVAVRYAWSSQIPWANLFNQAGLPAQTFRTDDWSSKSRPAR